MSNESENPHRVALLLTRDEADCLLSVLLQAGPLEGVSEETLVELLRRVTEAQRRSGVVRLPAGVQSPQGKLPPGP